MKFGIDTLGTLPQSSSTNMGVTLASGLRAFCIAVSLLLVTVHAADPVSPLIGATRDQILSRYGEPKSQMEAGSRVILFYAREKIVLRDNVVVDVEPLSAEPTTGTAESPPAVNTAKGSSEQSPAARPSAPVAPPPPASDSRVQIKIINSPSTKQGKASTTEPVAPPATTPPPAIRTPVTPQNSEAASRPPVTSPSSAPANADPTPRPALQAPEPISPATPVEPKKTEPTVQKKEPAPTAPSPNVTVVPVQEPDGMFGSRLFLILAAIVVGGIGLLYWRYRQRQFVLAATSVVNTPLAPAAAPAFTGSGFTADELGKLEWKRFEELVVAYYSKTGVVAARTKTGPESPVHIKISWKGEPRPFAYVQCIAQPSGLVDVKPLQSLVGALEADNIRRGYVVTSGKFNVQARNYAEEKHLTLLSAEVFLEKLNALPTAARAEIAQSIGAKDSTPA